MDKQSPWSRYSAWCCRHASSAQCNPVVVGIGGTLILGSVVIYGVGSAIHTHWTGVMQVVAGIAAFAACGVAALLFWGAMAIMNSGTLARAEHELEAEPPYTATAGTAPWNVHVPGPKPVQVMIDEAETLMARPAQPAPAYDEVVEQLKAAARSAAAGEGLDAVPSVADLAERGVADTEFLVGQDGSLHEIRRTAT